MSTDPPADPRVERFRTLYDRAYGDIDAYCRRRAPPGVAADAVSETFLVAWRRLDDVPDGDAGRLWLFGVARRVLANQRRGHERRDRLHLRLVAEHEVSGAPSGAPSGATTADDTEHVVAALATLREDDRELLRLVAWEQLSHADIAVVLGCSVNAVGIRAHRARGRLARAISRAAGRRGDDDQDLKGTPPAGHVPTRRAGDTREEDRR